MTLFRQADPRFPFFSETRTPQVAGRWHSLDDGPVQYLADTPDGAWAEFLRHEGIRDLADITGIQRTLWAIELDALPAAVPSLPEAILTGDRSSYPACQAEAKRLRIEGHDGLIAPSAALLPSGARGWRVNGGLQPGPDRDGRVIMLFGPGPTAVGWRSAVDAKPDPALLPRVKHFQPGPGGS